MSVILKENEWAEQMIREQSLGKKPSETLTKVARYYLDHGYSEARARNALDAFLLQCEPSSSIPKWSKALDYALARAIQYPAINIDCIEISKEEMDIVDALESRQIKRLAFTLLCLAKYWNVVTGKTEERGCWVNNKDSEIMAMANINTSIKRQNMLYWTLKEKGLIQLSKIVDNTNVRVCFVTSGETVLKIYDFRNLGYQYLKYHGEPYFECENCGIVEKIDNSKRGPKRKYCSKCAMEIKTRQSIESVSRTRRANRDSSENVGNN